MPGLGAVERQHILGLAQPSIDHRLDDGPVFGAEAFAVNGLDEALCLATVTEGLAGRLDPARQGRVRDDAPVPELLEEVTVAACNGCNICFSKNYSWCDVVFM